jgi:hypothetical protein
MRAAIFVVMLLALAGCGRQPQRPKVTEIEGTTEQRVAKATQILSKYCRPPSVLVDAHMAEEVFDNSGGWVPGPSDSNIYGILTVSAADLPEWKHLLSANSATHVQTNLLPAIRPTWWPASLAQAQYYDPKPLIGRPIGWAAVVGDSNIVFYAGKP